MILPLLLAATMPAQPPVRPPDGTYVYEATIGGSAVSTDRIVIKLSGASVIVTDAANVPPQDISAVTTSSFDAATLRQTAYTADFTLPTSTQHTDVTFAPGVVTVRVPGESVPIRADASAPFELTGDGLGDSFVLLLASLHANSVQAFTLARLEGGFAIPSHLSPAPGSATRPRGVPSSDVATTVNFAQAQQIFWYDPATYTIDAVTMPTQNLLIRLVSRTLGVVSAQTPQPVSTPIPTPFPHFTSTDVHFASTGGAVLAGTLTIPDARRERLPAFVFVHGSGPETRNGALAQNPTFLDLGATLSNAGYIVLRYDKRGIGASTGVATEDWHVLGGDVRAAVAFLRRQPGVDPNRIFLLGHSEGGIIVPLVAPSIPGVAGIVLMAPPAVPMERILDEQSHGRDSTLMRAVRGSLRSYDGIDPASVIRKVSVPILVLQGTRDIQILPSDLDHFVDAARAAHRNITVDLLGGDDHLFLKVPPGATGASEYTIPAPLDPRVAADILLWLRANRL